MPPHPTLAITSHDRAPLGHHPTVSKRPPRITKPLPSHPGHGHAIAMAMVMAMAMTIAKRLPAVDQRAIVAGQPLVNPQVGLTSG